MAELLSAFVSAFLSSAVEKIPLHEVKNVFRRHKVSEELIENLNKYVLSVSTVHSDAEEKQFTDSNVKDWLDKLRNTAYDVGDLLDEIGTKDKYKENKESSIASYLHAFSTELPSRVEDIVERLKSLVELKDVLGLKEGGVGKSLTYFSATTSLVDESRVYGRKDDRMKIVDFLLSNNSNKAGVNVIAIVGMRGIGKTTLAQVLYNDEQVKNHFELRSWASVSESMSIYEITREVLESFMSCQSDVVGFNALQVKLKDILTTKRFLVVLDAFENHNYLDWDVFLRPFQSSNSEGKIILTTRSRKVATSIRSELIVPLQFLSFEDSWNLFSYHAFMTKNQNQQCCDLGQVGRKIVNRCGGLPEALITLGSILYSKEEYEEWEKVYHATVVDLSRGRKNIFHELISTYVKLPRHLKECFAFCAIYLRGYEIDKWELIYLWMAEGILPPTPGKRMEDIGEECFEELISKSFIYCMQQKYSMHNLVHELSECVAGDFCYKLENKIPGTAQRNRVRHISYMQGVYDTLEEWEIYCGCKLMRTFLPFKPLVSDAEVSIGHLLSNTKKLRVLSLARYRVPSLPDSVGDLMHLRYLDLSDTDISSLPDSICSLYNLETLLLRGCTKLKLLPTKTSNLINLRKLDITNSNVEKMPSDFGKLNRMQWCPWFVVSADDEGSKISELGEVSGLHGSISIINLQNIHTGKEALNARLSDKKYLHNITLEWTSPMALNDRLSENVVIDNLKPHSNLKTLHIHGFGGDKFPSWQLEGSSKSSGGSSEVESLKFLQELYIEECPNLTGKLPNNLPSLTKLLIRSCPALHDSMPCVPRLRELNITSCETVASLPEEMIHGNQHIQSIVIESCSSLVSIPMNGVSRTISCLEISGCQKLQLFPQVSTENPHCYPVLKRLHLKCSCDSLASLEFSLFPKLVDLTIEDCPALHTISSIANNLLSLQNLKLKGCSQLVLFPERDFPGMPSLNSLHINGLAKLTSLEHIGRGCLTSLKHLTIEKCINLESLPPVTSLLSLTIKSCGVVLTKECKNDTGKYRSLVLSLGAAAVIED